MESGASLLPKRGPEALEYIPLGKKRSHSSDDQEEAQPKKVKHSGSPSSESTDGFTYMGKRDVAAVFGEREEDILCVCRRRCGGLHRWLLLGQWKSRRPSGYRSVLGPQPPAVRHPQDKFKLKMGCF